MQFVRNAIPNSFTLANLTCGVLGIIWVFNGKIEEACYLIWLAAGFDFFDGFLARALKATTEIGKQLDSLADLVTFGVLPSLIYYQLLTPQLDAPWPYLCLATALLSALRLAKFNIDEEQTVDFKGLTTTANGILASSVPLIIAGDFFLSLTFANPWFLLGFCLFFSALLVVPVTLFSLKFSNFKINENAPRFLLILLAIILGIVFKEAAIPLVLVSYLLLSLLSMGKNKK